MPRPLVLALALASALLQGRDACGQAQSQLSADFTLDWVKSGRLIYELDFEPKALVSAPAGTPQAIVDKLSKACNEIVNEPSLKKTLEANGFVVVGSTPQAATDFVKAEIEKWDGVVKANNISLD